MKSFSGPLPKQQLPHILPLALSEMIVTSESWIAVWTKFLVHDISEENYKCGNFCSRFNESSRCRRTDEQLGLMVQRDRADIEILDERPVGMGKRFGVLLSVPDPDYVKKRYGGYFNVFANMLGEAGETWEKFKVVDGEFPAMEELYKYDGFVVTGSRHDAHGNDVWILKLCHLLQTLHTMRIKVLGICFGHQVLCRALGGKTGRASGGWDIGLRRLTLFDGWSTKFSGLQIPSVISVIECHQDQVFKVPLGAEILASSEKTSIEMFSLGEHILGIQGHPEYTSDILFNIIDRLLDNNLIEEKISEEARASLETIQPDREIWQKICKSFLRTL